MTGTKHRQKISQPQAETDGDGQWSEPQILFMKRAIAVMSTILILGFMLLIWRIMQLTGPDRTPAREAGATARAIASPPTLKARAALALPPQSRIERISLSGRHLAVQYVSPVRQGIVIIDLVTGKAISHINITVNRP